MVAAMILALTLYAHADPAQSTHGGAIWEETAIQQQRPGFHPMIRFNTPSTMIRFSPAENYMLTTLDFVQQGQFQSSDGNYQFRSVSAMELEKADVAKLAAEMDPQAAKEFEGKYVNSTRDFEGTYDQSESTLTITYPIGGKPQSFALHLTTEGDDQLPLLVTDEAAALIGLWHAPEPFPDKLDARTRAKIDLDGLQRFAKEAAASNAAQFGIIDLHRDGTFRMHDIVGRWGRNGSILRLFIKGGEKDLAISTDGAKLLEGGKPAFLRN
jgi:hypothetical protein